MVSLKILSGKKAGAIVQLAKFPSMIGRGPDCHLILEEPGVWDRHFELNLDAQEGFILTALQSDAVVALNGSAFTQRPLRNGDLIEAASSKLQFFLTPPPQRSFRLRETLTWLGFCALAGAQAYTISWLLR